MHQLVIAVGWGLWFGLNAYAATDPRGSSLRIAAREGRLVEVTELLESGVPVDALGAFGETALQQAARDNRFKVVKYLLAEGADPNADDSDGYSPLLKASMTCGVRSAVALVRAGANVNADANDQRTSLIWAVEEGCEPIVKLLLTQKNLNLDHRDSQGRSALDYALKYALLEVGGVYSRIAGALKARGAQSFEWQEPLLNPLPSPSPTGHEKVATP